MAIDASQVQSAFTVPLDGVTQASQFYSHLNLQKAQLEDKKRKEAQAALLGTIDDYNNKAARINVGTGTPYDPLAVNNIQNGLTQVTDYYKQHPGDDVGARMLTGQILTHVNAQQDNAATLRETMLKRAAEVNKASGGILNEGALFNGFAHNAYYTTDEKGNAVLKPAIDPTVDYEGDILTNPAIRQKLYVPTAVDKAVREQFPKTFGLSPVSIDAKRGVMSGKLQSSIRPYETLNPDGTIALNSEDVALSDNQKIPGASDNILSNIKTHPALTAALELEQSKLAKQYPNATPQQLEKAAAYNIVKAYNPGGERPMTFDHSEYDAQHKLQREKIQDARASQYLSLAKNASSRADESLKLRKKAAEDDAIQPHQILTDAINGKTLNPAAAQIMHNAATTYIDMSSGLNLKSYPGTDVNAMVGQPVLKDPDNGRPARIILSYRPVNGKPTPMYVINYLDNDKMSAAQAKATKAKQPFTMPDMQRIVTGKDFTKLHNELYQQTNLQGAKGKNYDNYYEQQSLPPLPEDGDGE